MISSSKTHKVLFLLCNASISSSHTAAIPSIHQEQDERVCYFKVLVQVIPPHRLRGVQAVEGRQISPLRVLLSSFLI
ncbi:unnamed protein product [Albugo candida]|uniref:Uncharacterized protein n=1 Tax=Albugo candida TaxID=65357 RepID=A0A024GHR8_9STRA|nr:unnamed protein product [Albugo candida]|eukprot:CCI46393.1 unnamed protein product [Albugo candida]